MRGMCILLLPWTLFTGAKGISCPISNTDPCKCETDEGTVDLSSLDSGSSSEAGLTSTSDIYMFDYNPCTPFTIGQGQGGPGCENVLACQSDSTGYFPLGDTSDVQWGSDSSGNLQLTMSNTDSQGTYRITYVSLVCDQNTDKAFSASDGGSQQYYFTVTSKCCCPGGCSGTTPGGSGSAGISIGTIIIIVAIFMPFVSILASPGQIHGAPDPSGYQGQVLPDHPISCEIFIAVLLVYLVGGILFMHFSKGACGVEMIPNVTFWKTVPGLIKDGTMFVVYRVKGQSSSSYDQI